MSVHGNTYGYINIFCVRSAKQMENVTLDFLLDIDRGSSCILSNFSIFMITI